MTEQEPNSATERQTNRDEITCQLCKRDVPSRRITVIGGRSLCFDCASGWFDGDDEDEEAS